MLSRTDLEKKYIVEACLKECNLLLSTFRTEERRVIYVELMQVTICDPLSENPAHPGFYEIEIRLEIGISMFNCSAVNKWKQSVAWFPSYGAKSIADAEAIFFLGPVLM